MPALLAARYGAGIALVCDSAAIFSSRHFRHKQALASGEKWIGGNSWHQQAPSGWQFIGAWHLAQRVCIYKVFTLLGRVSSARLPVELLRRAGVAGFLVSGAKRMLS